MADRALVLALVANGVSTEDAEDMINRVSEGVVELLAAKKRVRIEGVGTLSAPEKDAAFGEGRATNIRCKRRRVQIAGTVLWKGPPLTYEREKAKIRMSRMIGA